MIGVIGLGFVGLTTALGFAECGHNVIGVEANNERADNILKGKIDFNEPYLREKLQQHLNNNLQVKPVIDDSICCCDYVFICVGSPCDDSGNIDLSYVKKACLDVSIAMQNTKDNKIIVIKSTVTPGSTEEVQEYIKQQLSSSDNIEFCCNPEFLREGKCWEDFVHPGKVIIGSNCDEAAKSIAKLYDNIDTNIVLCTLKEAEFSKYLSNVMLSTLISMSNEFAFAAESFGDIDIKKVFCALHLDERLSNSGITTYIYPGCGFGGYCLPKDTQAFISALKANGMKSDFFEEVIKINNKASQNVINKVKKISTPPTQIGIMGLSFKPGSDDVRFTQSYKIIEDLLQNGYTNIITYDPAAIEAYKTAYPHQSIQYANSSQELIDKCEVVIVATAWDEFKDIDYSNVKLIDARYCI